MLSLETQWRALATLSDEALARLITAPWRADPALNARFWRLVNYLEATGVAWDDVVEGLVRDLETARRAEGYRG